MKLASGLLLLAAILVPCRVAPAQVDTDADGFRISVNVNLVVLQATVRTHDGRDVPELSQQNFEVLEDGTPQRIRLFRHQDAPVTVGLVIDHSGSMREKLAEVTAGARAFVQSSNSKDQMFVVNFNEHATLGLPQNIPFSDSVEQLGNAIGRAPAIGTTALYDAISGALTRLQQGSNEKKVLVVISDGGDNASNSRLEDVLKMARLSTAMIYTIGVFGPDDLDKNPHILRRLAQETGGESFLPNELKDTVAICEQIARDIRNQYTIGYFSENAKQDGAYRKIRLLARDGANAKLTVRARSGYIASVAK